MGEGEDSMWMAGMGGAGRVMGRNGNNSNWTIIKKETIYVYRHTEKENVKHYNILNNTQEALKN